MSNLKEISTEYNHFPETFKKAAKKMVFVHKFGNLDRVKVGQDLITRATCESITNKSLMKVKVSQKLPVGHVFLGVVGSKETATAYVHESTEEYALIGSMSSHIVS